MSESVGSDIEYLDLETFSDEGIGSNLHSVSIFEMVIKFYR
jgi:hypothetical protein